jgi:putative hydrolase of the HAD superfamily
MIRAILFDFEQTLVEVPARRDPATLFRDGASRCYAFLSALEVRLPAFESFYRRQKWIYRRLEWLRMLIGAEPDSRRFLRRMCKDYGLQRDHGSLATLAWKFYEPHTQDMRLPADVIPTLQTLVDNDIELGLVINTPWLGQVIDQHLEALGLLEFFPVRAYSTEIGACKPDPRLFEAALHALHVNAAQTLYVSAAGKSELLGAQRLGMKTVYRRAESVGGAPWADHQIRQISELLTLPPLGHLQSLVKPIATPIPQLIV